MIVRIGRSFVGRRGMLLQLLHHPRDRFLELRIVALAHLRRILLHIDIGCDADVLNTPLPFGR